MVVGIYGEDELWQFQIEKEINTSYKILAGKIEIYNFKTQEQLRKFNAAKLDVCFLDLDLENQDGIKIASEINHKWINCLLVFYSGNLRLATEVYGIPHIYFVLKEQMETKMKQILKIVMINYSRQRHLSFSVIGGKTIVLLPDDIIFFERIKRITRIESIYGTYDIWDKLGELEDRLKELGFVRCHNSYIVYLPAVIEIQKNVLIMKNKMKVTISRSYRKSVQDALNMWLLK